MNPELSVILSLRSVLESARDGKGVAGSLVHEFKDGGQDGKEVARRVLLGMPVETSVRPIQSGASTEIGILTSLLVGSGKSSSALVGRNGEVLSRILERWVKERGNRRLEDRVLRFRGLITSGVLGAVAGMLATLGPLLGTLSFSQPPPQTDSNGILYAAAAMATTSSAFLGVFMGGGRVYLNVLVSALAFVLVFGLVSPLASLPAGILWGIK